MMIFTALSPNTQKDDFKLALNLIFKRDEYLEGKYRDLVRNWFKDYFEIKYVATYESARTALYFLLKEFGIGNGDKVAVQAFTCVAVVNPIKWTGAKPIFIDIDPKNFNMDLDDLENKINGNVKAIIFQHTFGYPEGIDKVIELARSKGIYVIEDCAHTIGTEYRGKKLGSFGDAAIFSLGRDKAVSASFGGVSITKRRKYGSKLVEKEKFLNSCSKSWVFKQILYTVVSYLTRNLYGISVLGKLIHFVSTKLELINRATTNLEKESGEMPQFVKSIMPNAFAKVAYNQLEKLDELNKKRSEIYDYYLKEVKEMKTSKITLPEWKEINKFYPIRFPLLVKKRDKLIEYAERNGIILGKWYDTPVAPKGVDLLAAGYKRGSCPKAEKVCDNIVNLPIHINLRKKDISKIIKVLKSFYRIREI